jgi:hypothetical protein
MEIATENETNRFISAIWYRWGETLVREIAKHYDLTDVQREALCEILCKPNDWQLRVLSG